MGDFLQVTPFLHVRDLDAAVAFFRDTLGFTVYIHRDGYAYVQRDAAAFRIMQLSPEDAAVTKRPSRGFAYYIDVRDVDAVVAELRPRLEALNLPPGDVVGPCDQSYGQREFMILAPDGRVLVFGSPIPPPPTSTGT